MGCYGLASYVEVGDSFRSGLAYSLVDERVRRTQRGCWEQCGQLEGPTGIKIIPYVIPGAV